MLAGIIPSQDCPDMTMIYDHEAAALTACCQANMTVEVGQVFLIVNVVEHAVNFTMHVVKDHLGSKVLSEATYRARLLQVSGLQEASRYQQKANPCSLLTEHHS